MVMKQYIEPEQLGKLSEKGMKRLRKWWKSSSGDCYVSSTGDINGALISSLYRLGSPDETIFELLTCYLINWQKITGNSQNYY